jgi:hypothetical protein
MHFKFWEIKFAFIVETEVMSKKLNLRKIIDVISISPQVLKHTTYVWVPVKSDWGKYEFITKTAINSI